MELCDQLSHSTAANSSSVQQILRRFGRSSITPTEFAAIGELLNQAIRRFSRHDLRRMRKNSNGFVNGLEPFFRMNLGILGSWEDGNCCCFEYS